MNQDRWHPRFFQASTNVPQRLFGRRRKQRKPASG